MLSGFEMARGYIEALVGLPKRPLNAESISAYQPQVAKLPLLKLVKDINPNIVPLNDLKPRTDVYYFKKSTKFGSWKNGFVSSADDHIVQIPSSNYLRGRPVRTTREDVRIAPSSTLLQELDEA